MYYKIAFYYTGRVLKHDMMLKEPLGGTETALLYTAKSLARMGHLVTIFTNCDKEEEQEGVTYISPEHLEEFQNTQFDILVSVRSFLPILSDFQARFFIYFSPDGFDQPFLRGILKFEIEEGGGSSDHYLINPLQLMSFIDRIFCVGKWQAATFANYLRFPQEKLYVTKNGLNPHLFRNYKDFSERKKKMVYSSTPFRGLKQLLECFSVIKSEINEVELDVFSGMQIYGLSGEEDKKLYGDIYRLAENSPGINFFGPVSQKVLSEKLSEALVFAYPNTFPETFCIAALEAQAAGVVPVTSCLGALPERIENNFDGYLIEGDPKSSEFKDKFIDRVVYLLKNRQIWAEMSEKARKKVLLNYSYDQLALEWTQYFNSLKIKDHPVRRNNFSSKNITDQIIDNQENKPVKITKAEIIEKLLLAFQSGGFEGKARNFY